MPTVYCATCRRYSRVSIPVPPSPVKARRHGPPCPHCGALARPNILMFGDFGWFRDQMCVLACPYGRLQNVMADPDTILVAYDEKRGEPRATQRKRHDEGGEQGDE